jgi:small GTP-binding protein
VIFLGASGVGKTCLIQRFMYAQFSRDYENTIGVDCFTRTLTVNDTEISFQIWDTAGQEKYSSLATGYIRDSQIAIIVYDLSKAAPLKSIEYWHQVVLDQRGSDIRFLLAGNKLDLPRAVDETEIKAFLDRNQIRKVEVSAKTGDKVGDLFQAVADEVGKIGLGVVEPGVTLEPVVVQTAQGCC